MPDAQSQKCRCIITYEWLRHIAFEMVKTKNCDVWSLNSSIQAINWSLKKRGINTYSIYSQPQSVNSSTNRFEQWIMNLINAVIKLLTKHHIEPYFIVILVSRQFLCWEHFQWLLILTKRLWFFFHLKTKSTFYFSGDNHLIDSDWIGLLL